MNIFISYRRDDTILAAKLLHTELEKRYGGEQVFMDIDDIGYGDDFVAAIDARLDQAEVVLVVIGPRWEEMLQQRVRGDDWVRHEVARALELRAANRAGTGAGDSKAERPRVIPVLVQQAKPVGGPLTPDLAALRSLNAISIDERALNASITTLLEAINRKTFEAIVEEDRWRERVLARMRVLAPLIGLALFCASWVKLFDYLDLDTGIGTETMRLAGIAPAPPPWSGKVVLVAIDPATVKAVGRAFDASWRSEHARLIRNTAAAGALSIGFDLFLDARAGARADAALEQALRDTQATMPVVFGVQDMDGNVPKLLPRFAALAHFGIACAGERLTEARAMPLAVQRAATPPVPATAPLRDRVVVHPSLGLATYSGGGRVEPLDERTQTVQVLLPREQRSQVVSYFYAETVTKPQPACEAIMPGDRSASQLFDPFTLPSLREPPQRLAYESVLAGDPATLAALRGRIVLVGLQLPGEDELPMSGPGGKRWGVDLIAAQIDALARSTAVRPIGAVGQWAIMTAMATLGAVLSYRLRLRALPLRIVAWIVVPLGFALAVIAWYRMEGQLIALPYGVVAYGLGAWLMLKFTARTKP